MLIFFSKAERIWTLTAVLTAVAIGIAYYLTAPLEAIIRNTDSARHAMNGAFLLDALRAMPWENPMDWANSYYNQYPAITFGFYPPLPSVLLALFYALFGVSIPASVIFMAFFSSLLFAGVYVVARHALPVLGAFTAMVLLAGTAGTLIWGRQMMLEIPMMAFSIWSIYFFIRYLHTDRWQDFFWAAGVMVAALYTKQTAGFFIFPMACIFVWQKQFAGLKRVHIWIIAAPAVIALIPLLILQVKFADVNVMNVVSRPDIDSDRFSMESILWYPAQFAGMTSVPFMLAAIFGAASLAFYWRRISSRYFWALLIASFIIGLCLLTAITLKEPRHATLLLPALAIIAAAPLALMQPSIHWQAAAFAASLMLLGYGLITVQVDTIEGPKIAADRILEYLPEGGNVAISAQFDGPFIFRLREQDPDRRYHITRIDKLLLNIIIMPTWGLNPNPLNENEISKLLSSHNFSYIIVDPTDYMSAEPMRIFAHLLLQPPYILTDTIPVIAHGPKRVLLIYKNTAVRNDAPPVAIQQKPSVLGP